MRWNIERIFFGDPFACTGPKIRHPTNSQRPQPRFYFHSRSHRLRPNGQEVTISDTYNRRSRERDKRMLPLLSRENSNLTRYVKTLFPQTYIYLYFYVLSDFTVPSRGVGNGSFCWSHNDKFSEDGRWKPFITFSINSPRHHSTPPHPHPRNSLFFSHSSVSMLPQYFSASKLTRVRWKFRRVPTHIHIYLYRVYGRAFSVSLDFVIVSSYAKLNLLTPRRRYTYTFISPRRPPPLSNLPLFCRVPTTYTYTRFLDKRRRLIPSRWQ